MLKHIVGQAIYQFAMILLLLFYGDHFLPEYKDSLDDQILRDNNPLTYKYNIEDGKCNFSFFKSWNLNNGQILSEVVDTLKFLTQIHLIMKTLKLYQ